MTAKLDDLGAFRDYTRRTFEPAARLNELVAQNVERVARRQRDFAKLSTDAQAGFARWFEDTTAGVG